MENSQANQWRHFGIVRNQFFVDLSLYRIALSIKFTYAPILPKSIEESNDNIVILVATVSNVFIIVSLFEIPFWKKNSFITQLQIQKGAPDDISMHHSQYAQSSCVLLVRYVIEMNR